MEIEKNRRPDAERLFHRDVQPHGNLAGCVGKDRKEDQELSGIGWISGNICFGWFAKHLGNYAVELLY
jgi:hypothetical protein